MAKNKNCPFCNKEVEIIEPWTSGGVSHCGSITCKVCGYSIGWHHPFLEQVWNNRYPLNKGEIMTDGKAIASLLTEVSKGLYPDESPTHVFTGGNVGTAISGTLIADAIKQHAEAVNNLASVLNKCTFIVTNVVRGD